MSGVFLFRTMGWDGMDVQAVLDFTLIDTRDVTITAGGLLGGLATFVVVAAVSWVVRRQVLRLGSRNPSVSRSSVYTLSRLLYYVLLAFGALLALNVAGLGLGRFGLFAGALGVGLGFGLQTVFSNFVSGLILLFDRSLKVGDFVDLPSGPSGEVRDIKMRATRITTNDNVDILVPNSEFINGHVINWTHRDDSRRLRVPFGVAYGTDKDLVRRAALEAAESLPFTLRGREARAPQVWLVEFGESSLNFELVVWITASATKRPIAVQAAYTWALHTALMDHGIEIPFPQRDLNLRSVAGFEGEAALRAVGIDRPQRSGMPPEHGSDAADDASGASTNDAQADAEHAIRQDSAVPDRADAPPDERT